MLGASSILSKWIKMSFTQDDLYESYGSITNSRVLKVILKLTINVGCTSNRVDAPSITHN